ncbi:MAG: flagellar protein FlgN [Clostridiales Family XIII bacterium]|jgi:hypothetical protein|nr:flagellar protein FlgN [Clostridiales Family XIII bacterium]
MGKMSAAPKGVIDEFYEYLCVILDVYGDMLSSLKEEAVHIDAGDVAALDVSLNIQQAMLFKTRNFEGKIADYLDRLGIKADTLSATIAQLPDDEQFRFYTFLGEFDQIMHDVVFYKDKCRELLQSKLFVIERQLARYGGTDAATYDKNAGEVANPRRASGFEKKI